MWSTCQECGKRLYHDRRAAKEVIRRAQQATGGYRMREYRCPAGLRGFHIGHLPGDVRRGVRSATDHYQLG